MEYQKENISKRNIYIDNHSREKSLSIYMEALNIKYKSEIISVNNCLNRVTTAAVFANISSPHYHNAAMDGIVVKVEDTYKATERNPVVLTKDVNFQYINTGNPIPEGYNAVIMIEDVIPINESQVKIMESTYPWENIRIVGEDIAKGEMILPSNHLIRAVDIGALLSACVGTIEVFKIIKVGVIPTGNELTRDLSDLKEGQIIDSNSYMFKALLEEAGCIATLYNPVNDNPELLQKVILEAIDENDLAIVNAGSSAGTKDYTADIISKIGDVIIHGIAMKPGKPTILGKIGEKGVVGIPGYPVSAYFSFKAFVEPIIKLKTKNFNQFYNKVEAVLTKRIVKSLKYEEFIRVTLGNVNDQLIATPINRGAGNTTSLVRADGILVVPREIEGIEAGEIISVNLMKPLEFIESRVVLIGSHDIILDIIGDILPVSSTHIGSLGGIISKIKKECLIAPIHLIDEKTGKYNDFYVRKYFPKKEMSIIHGVKRLQGFIVKKNNPKNIKGFDDLSKKNIIFVNRQKGSGTRQLVDFNLNEKGIDVSTIQGYNKELTTHMAIAVAISSSVADVGVGIYSAAKSMDLDFIPIGYESYEFLVSTEELEDSRVEKFIDVISSDTFKSKVENLGGYELDETGNIRNVV
ncbi:MAG: molybdopterin biosynthesis protein [Clostridiales bacterium]